ncbi:MAG: hypothetical protein K9G58_06040 [Bacteroidales bacterium]|nr:hypothetical protein [Bacteroidales bacterium]MCF8397707.1 hypothetical protein [Bacteroidales bacterium]
MKRLIKNIGPLIFLLLPFVLYAGQEKYPEELLKLTSGSIDKSELQKTRSLLEYFEQFSFVREAGIQQDRLFVITDSDNISFIKQKTESYLKLYIAAEDECCCPKTNYDKFTRNTLVCSDGTNEDSGWQPAGSFEHCGNMGEPPEGSTDCETNTDPGDHFGEDDVTCTACSYVKYDITGVDSSECCKASPLTTTVSISVPAEIESIANSVAGMASAAPMISEMEFSLEGQGSLTKGEECCLPDPCAEPVEWEEYGFSVSAGVSVTVNVPGWSWSFSHQWNGIYHIHAEISLGPKITLNPSGTASATGKKYNGDCPGCVTFNLQATVGLEVKFEGKIEAVIELEIWPYKTWEVEASAEMGAQTSISAKGYKKCCVCTGQGGCVGYGSLEGFARLTFVFMGKSFSKEWLITIMPGWSNC